MLRTLQLIFFASYLFSVSYSQTTLHLMFPPKIGGNDLVTGNVYQDLNGVSMSVDNFCYYISDIHIYHDGGQHLDLSDTVVLIKDNAFDIYMGVYNFTNVESIDFGVGVPQDVNHSDISLYDESDPLSWQSPSMHWGWTSGYKFMLCDGYGDGTGDGNPESLFQLHNLGDANYKNVSMPVVPTQYPSHTAVVINCNLDEWIFGANPGSTGVLHGTTGLNASTMNNVETRSVFEQGADASLSNLTKEGNVIFYSEGENLNFKWSNIAGAKSFKIIGANGSLISEGNTNGNGETSVMNVAKGSYFIFLLDENGNHLNSIKALY